MSRFLPLTLFASIVFFASVDQAAAQATCTPGGPAISVALPELTYDPTALESYFIGVAGATVPFTPVAGSGVQCQLQAATSRALDLHPFVAAGEADVVPAIPLVTVEVNAVLDIRPGDTPPLRQCNYDDIDGDPAHGADCFHASHVPTGNPDEAARWTAHVRIVNAGTDGSVVEFDRTFWVNLAQLPGGITTATPLDATVAAASLFLQQEQFDHLEGVFRIAVFASSIQNIAITDPYGRRAGHLTTGDIPFSSYLTHGTREMIVVLDPLDGFYSVHRTRFNSGEAYLSRVDLTGGLKQPAVDELAGKCCQSVGGPCCPTGSQLGFVLTPAPYGGTSPREHLLQAYQEHVAVTDVRPGGQSFSGLDFYLGSVLEPRLWLHEYRLSLPTFHQNVITSLTAFVKETMAAMANRHQREERGGRDPGPYDARYTSIQYHVVVATRALVVTALYDIERAAAGGAAGSNDAKVQAVFAKARQAFADGDHEIVQGHILEAMSRYSTAHRQLGLAVPYLYP